jgi:hypothetical protein
VRKDVGNSTGAIAGKMTIMVILEGCDGELGYCGAKSEGERGRRERSDEGAAGDHTARETGRADRLAGRMGEEEPYTRAEFPNHVRVFQEFAAGRFRHRVAPVVVEGTEEVNDYNGHFGDRL